MQHYLLKESRPYEAWRAQKLYKYPKDAQQLIIELNNPIKLVDNELISVKSICGKTNIALYRCASSDQDGKQVVISLAQQLGLHQLDANLCADDDRISIITDAGEQKSFYIPYTNKPLNWHTDGYYNTDEQRIHAFIMHCVHPAKSGGENNYLDPEIAYILLRDENPNYIQALMDVEVMTIPANVVAGKQIRSAQTGPVFFVDENTQALCMRYTARQRNIIWKKDKIVQSAIVFLQEILQASSFVFRYTLKAGEGVVCNNVLHNRTAFEDHADADNKRILYRGRFYNRVTVDSPALDNAVNQ
jgi:alpha-ketoglutarate-dependent taurine dioxygenase